MKDFKVRIIFTGAHYVEIATIYSANPRYKNGDVILWDHGKDHPGKMWKVFRISYHEYEDLSLMVVQAHNEFAKPLLDK